MKRKRITSVLILILIIIATWAAFTNWQTFFPSQQMKELRQLETSLDLPKPKYRNEKDLGMYRDGKGASHYDRHITLSYADATVLDTLRVKLLSDAWQENEAEQLSDYKYFSFKKGSGDEMKCVNGYTKPADTDGITLYVSLQASGEYSCNPAPVI